MSLHCPLLTPMLLNSTRLFLTVHSLFACALYSYAFLFLILTFQGYILNYDPPLNILLQKAFLYGKNRNTVQNLEIPDDILVLINKLNRSTLNIKALGIGRGYIIQILRGLTYELGRIIK